MAQHSIFGGELRPDQQRYARMMGGMSSPLWLPFMAAASVGATWWMMQNWTRFAAGARDGADGAAAKPEGDGQSASQPQPAQAQRAQAMNAQARSFAQEVSAPLTEALAVQGANDAESRAEPAARKEAAPAPATPAPTAKAAAAPKAAAEPKTAEPKTAETKTAPAAKAPAKAEASPQLAARAKAATPSATAAKKDPAVDRLLAAAAASHPEPELPPHEGLPARKKGGKSKKNGG